MLRFIEGNDNIRSIRTKDERFNKECLVLNETVWNQGREYFTWNILTEPVPVVNMENQVVCYAWIDYEARREIRILQELAGCDNAITFSELYPDYDGVIIHGCNELAYYMREYLIKLGITVTVDGKYWKEIGIKTNRLETVDGKNYEIWAEGVHQKSRNWKNERLRSASVEFECLDEIYEANIKSGIIKDANQNADELLKRLRTEKEIIIRGIGTKAQDAYDWLFGNGIDICAFQSGKAHDGRKNLFGKPILKREEVKKQFKQAVVIECSARHSAWGFGDVDAYDYEGYKRNKHYLLLRDYIEVPEKNLKHLCAGKNLILIGDIRLCNRVNRWWMQQEIGKNIKYWDVLSENDNKIKQFDMAVTGENELTENDVYLLVLPQYSYEGYLTKEAVGKKALIINKLLVHGINDFTDYFTDLTKCIYLETTNSKYTLKELRPAGILLGAIPAFSGNLLIKQSLAGHPQLVMIEEFSIFNNELYTICIRLAEEPSDSIMHNFWALWEQELGSASIERNFSDRERFQQRMENFLKLSTRFTSQELLVMFHLSYEAMHGREIENLERVIIYWEPHMCSREYVRRFAYWLKSDEIRGFTLSTVRNRYICAGSSMRYLTGYNWMEKNNIMYCYEYISDENNEYGDWKEKTIKFEELKMKPRENLQIICEWLGIAFSETLMETTIYGEQAFYDGLITGFDIKPAINLYEEFFSVFDRMRISMVACAYQKRYGYPYVNCMEFSRRELQEMFLKKFRWEKLSGTDEENMFDMQKKIRHWLWQERFAEVMEIETVE